MKILVIGDSCNDIYKYGICDRLDQEAPVPIFKEVNEESFQGMSLNVANNITSLGINCDLITNKLEIKKIRYVDSRSNQLVMRVDENDSVKRIKNLKKINFMLYDAVIVSDYNKGFLYEEDMEYISNNSKLSFLQTNKVLSDWCSGFDYIKINNYEYSNTSQFTSEKFLNQINLIITRGEKGVTYKNKNFPISKPVMVRSLAGAGDTFLSALVVKFLETNDIVRSIKFAQNSSKSIKSTLKNVKFDEKTTKKTYIES